MHLRQPRPLDRAASPTGEARQAVYRRGTSARWAMERRKPSARVDATSTKDGETLLPGNGLGQSAYAEGRRSRPALDEWCLRRVLAQKATRTANTLVVPSWPKLRSEPKAPGASSWAISDQDPRSGALQTISRPTDLTLRRFRAVTT